MQMGSGHSVLCLQEAPDPQLLGAHHNLHPAHILTSELPPTQCMETAAIPPPTPPPHAVLGTAIPDPLWSTPQSPWDVPSVPGMGFLIAL